MAVIVVLVVLNLFQFFQINQLRQDISSLQYQMTQKDSDITDLRKADLQAINFGFVGENFAGIVFNAGYMMAHNAKVVLSSGAWSYEISLGDIDYHSYKAFNEYIPLPASYSHAIIMSRIDWLP